jgi:hypothetical protein
MSTLLSNKELVVFHNIKAAEYQTKADEHRAKAEAYKATHAAETTPLDEVATVTNISDALKAIKQHAASGKSAMIVAAVDTKEIEKLLNSDILFS